jgi:hypothetical protein
MAAAIVRLTWQNVVAESALIGAAVDDQTL